MKETEIVSGIDQRICKFNEDVNVIEASVENIWNEFMKESDSVILEVDKLIQEKNSEMEMYRNDHLDFIAKDVADIEDYMKGYDKDIGNQKNQILENFYSIQKQFQEDVKQEENNIKQGSDKLKGFIESVKEQSYSMFREEKKEGEETFTNLLQLLENACSKIERTFGSY